MRRRRREGKEVQKTSGEEISTSTRLIQLLMTQEIFIAFLARFFPIKSLDSVSKAIRDEIARRESGTFESFSHQQSRD
jgi:hypothetical protein